MLSILSYGPAHSCCLPHVAVPELMWVHFTRVLQCNVSCKHRSAGSAMAIDRLA